MANSTKFVIPVKAKIEGKTVNLMARNVIQTPEGARCLVSLKGKFKTLTRKKKAKIFQPA